MSQVLLAVPQNDIAATRGNQSRALSGTGTGVRIAILDGGIDILHPAISGSTIASRDFSGSGTYNDDRTGTGHATGIAGLYVGHNSDFTGLVPSAGIINARVITDSDSTSNYSAGNGLFWSLRQKADVVSLSFGNRLNRGPLTSQFNLMTDYAAQWHGATVVVAAGNENDTAVRQVPAGAYNILTVGSLQSGAYDHVSDFSNYSLSTDSRTKPEIVAPGESVNRPAANWETSSAYTSGSGTSFSAPIVGGIAAQLIGYGKAHGLTTDPLIMRAVLMTSARKVFDYAGDAWAPRSSLTQRNGSTLYDKPLDPEQGAGRVDGVSAYRVYSKTQDADHVYTNWLEGRLRADHSYSIALGDFSAGQRIEATLAWFHRVDRRDNGDGVADSSDTYFEAATLADFALFLVKDGKTVAVSDSDVDNLEHLSWVAKSSGTYSLTAYRYPGTGVKRESYALAMRVLDDSSVLQSLESSPGVLRSLDLTSANSAGVMRSIQTPEPAGMTLIAGAMILLARRRR